MPSESLSVRINLRRRLIVLPLTAPLILAGEVFVGFAATALARPNSELNWLLVVVLAVCLANHRETPLDELERL